jgi:Flp pilus assembly protein TadG
VGVHSRATRERGAVAVEFALVVPILFVLVFGIIGFGIVFGQSLALSNAARDAARFSVVKQVDNSSGRTCKATVERARSAAASIGMSPGDVGVAVTLNGDPLCGVTAGQPSGSATGPSLNKGPCDQSTSGTKDQLQVVTTFKSELFVPIASSVSFDLSGKGYFRCEYSTP